MFKRNSRSLGFLGLLVLFLAFSLYACSFSKALEKTIPDDIRSFADNYIETVRSGDLEDAIALLDPSIASDASLAQIQPLRAYLNLGDLVSYELASGKVTRFGTWDGYKGPSFYRYTIQYYLRYSAESVFQPDLGGVRVPTADDEGNYHQLISMIIDRKDGVYTVYSFHVNYYPESPETANALNLDKKPMWMAFFLVLVAAVPIFILYTAWVCFRTVKRRRWRWIIFILLGFGGIGLNWTTGELYSQLLAFNVFGSGISKIGLYTPWFVGTSIPLGAILFHIKKEKLQALPAKGEEPVEPPVLPGPQGEGDVDSSAWENQ